MTFIIVKTKERGREKREKKKKKDQQLCCIVYNTGLYFQDIHAKSHEYNKLLNVVQDMHISYS